MDKSTLKPFLCRCTGVYMQGITTLDRGSFLYIMTDQSVINDCWLKESKEHTMRKKNKDIRERVIKSAVKMFAEKGFFRTTVEDIARSARIAKGTLYLYFKDKETLYLATVEKHFERGLMALADIETAQRSSEEKLMDIASQFIDYMNGLKDTYPMFTFENLHITGRIMKKIRPVVMPKLIQMTEIISRIIKEGAKNGEFVDVEPKIAAFYFLSTIRTAFFGRAFMPEGFSDDDTVIKLFFKGLKKKEVF
jgi:TetR/AcrR family fatty acid metabolism transcriptional regulator